MKRVLLFFTIFVAGPLFADGYDRIPTGELLIAKDKRAKTSWTIALDGRGNAQISITSSKRGSGKINLAPVVVRTKKQPFGAMQCEGGKVPKNEGSASDAVVFACYWDGKSKKTTPEILTGIFPSDAMKDTGHTSKYYLKTVRKLK